VFHDSFGSCHSSSVAVMEVVVDYEYLTGTQHEIVIKKLSVAAEIVLETFHFQNPYAMRPHGDKENGLNWDDEHIPYHKLSTVLSEAVTGFEHLYGYGESRCNLLAKLFGRPVDNLEDLNCPKPRHFIHKYGCTKQCNRNPSFRCATRNAHSLYDWLMYHFQKMSCVTCPEDMNRHTTRCVSAV